MGKLGKRRRKWERRIAFTVEMEKIFESPEYQDLMTQILDYEDRIEKERDKVTTSGVSERS